MKKILMYEVPDAELIELKLENNQMEGGSPTGESFGNQTGNDDETGWN